MDAVGVLDEETVEEEEKGKRRTLMWSFLPHCVKVLHKGQSAVES